MKFLKLYILKIIYDIIYNTYIKNKNSITYLSPALTISLLLYFIIILIYYYFPFYYYFPVDLLRSYIGLGILLNRNKRLHLHYLFY